MLLIACTTIADVKQVAAGFGAVDSACLINV